MTPFLLAASLEEAAGEGKVILGLDDKGEDEVDDRDDQPHTKPNPCQQNGCKNLLKNKFKKIKDHELHITVKLE